MTNYTNATAKDLADTLLRQGDVSFAARYETDSNGVILKGEDWFGAVIVNQFNGQCILVTSYGGGMCFVYNVTQINDILPVEVAESTFAYLLRHDLRVPDGTVCVETIQTSKLASDTLEFDRIRAHAGHNVEVTLYGDGVNVSVECIDCHEVIYTVDNPAMTKNDES